MEIFSYQSLAPLNSILNSVAAVLLLAGFICIRWGWVRAHRAFMLSAFATSIAFFTSYVIYHYHVGDVRFQAHRRIAVWTWPIWIYVSVTGVIVYLMCYQLYAPRVVALLSLKPLWK